MENSESNFESAYCLRSERRIHNYTQAKVTVCIGQISELRLKEDNFNSWVERFELYIKLIEINAHTNLTCLILLGNDGYSL